MMNFLVLKALKFKYNMYMPGLVYEHITKEKVKGGNTVLKNHPKNAKM